MEADTELDMNIAAYEGLQTDLEMRHMGRWVLVQGGNLIRLSDSFQEAAGHAVETFGRGPFLLRQVGASSVVLPAGVHPAESR